MTACRLLCHTLVQRLPDGAFSEAVEVLADMFEFYRGQAALPLQHISNPIKATVAGSYTAPVFPVLEE